METILHITDLHFGCEGDNPSSKAQRKVCLGSLLAEISKLDTAWKPSVICLTGDLAWRGAASDYAEAKQWLDDLLSRCDLTYERLVICPGNHEVNRKIAEKMPRPSTALEADKALEPPIDEYFLRPFSAVIEFCKNSGIPVLKFGDTESYLVGERILGRLRFVVLNSAWFSKDNEDKGKLWLGFKHLQYMESHGQLPLIQPNTKIPTTVALMHHPPEWLHPEEQHAFDFRPNTLDYLARRCHVLLTGHTHGEVRRADQIAEGARHFTGGATYAGVNYYNSFRLLRIEGNLIVYRSFAFDPRSAENQWKSSEVVSLPIVAENQAAGQPVLPGGKGFTTIELRAALRANALRQRDQKSRLLRPSGHLPNSVPQQVSVP